MITNLILCSLMTFIIFFFVVLMNSFSIPSLIYAVFLIFIFARMTFEKSQKKVIYRRIFQVLFAVLFCISFIANLYETRGSMALTEGAMSNAEVPFCHIAIPQVLMPFIITKNIVFPARISGHYAAISSMIFIWLFTTLLIGRGWCSWVCFYGGWEEGFRQIGKKRKLNILSKNKEIREFQFGFFGFIVLASICEMSAVYCQWFCPFKLVTEFSPINSVTSLIAAVLFIGLFLGLVVVMPILTKKRTQCSSLCPFGAFASLTDGISMFKIKIDNDKCIGCMKCANTCPFSAIDIKTIQEKKGKPELTCAKCGECVSVCPQKAISYEFSFAKKCGHKHFEPKSKFGKVFQKLLDPEQLFRFAAFTFGVIISSSFSVQSIQMIIKALLKF